MKSFNYNEFVGMIRRITLSHPLVSNFYTDKYRLNSSDDIEYPAVVMTTNDLSVSDNVTTISFNMLYADRLTESRENSLEVKSVGCDVLTEIYNAIRNKFDMDGRSPVRLNPFSEQFADNVAGCVATISVDMPSNIGSCDWIELEEDKCYNK